MSSLNSKCPFNVLIIVILIAINIKSSLAYSNFNVNLHQNLLNEGFHRNLTYIILFEEYPFSDCLVGLDQELPAGVYANPDELGDLRRTQKINIIPKNRVNIELPAEQSSPSSIFLIGDVKSNKVSLWTPVHARYHHAAKGGGVARNDIPAPKLYLRCPDDRLLSCDRSSMKMIRFLCDASSKEKCDWMHVTYTAMSLPPHWAVPIGDLDHYYPVAVGTAVVIIAASSYLLRAMHQYKVNSNKKKIS